MSPTSYDDIAEWYDTWIGTSSIEEDAYFPTVAPLMGDIDGRRICDLACGEGRVARYLADRGAQVVGIDVSRKLLGIAQRHEEEEPHGIRYFHADAQNLEGFADATFDGVVCHMALMDIPDLAATLESVARVLRPGGSFVFSILHPCYHTSESEELELAEGMARSVRRYFAEGYWRSNTRPGPPGKVGAYHRTPSTYINTLADAGLAIERSAEPAPPRKLGDSPSLSGSSRPVWHEVPAVLVLRCRKRG